VRRSLPVLLVCGLALSACQFAGSDDGSASAPSVQEQEAGNVLLAGAEGAEVAVEASGALYESAPVVLVAPAGDAAAQARAASAAVALGAPVLLAPDGPADDADAAAEEVERLDADALLVFGDARAWADSVDGVDVVTAPADPEQLGALTGAEFGEEQPVAEEELLRAVAELPAGDDAAPMLSLEGAPAPAPGGAAGEESTLPALESAEPVEGVVVLAANDDPAAVAAVATARSAGADVRVLDSADPRSGAGTVEALSDGGAETVLALGDAFGPQERLDRLVEVAATGVQLPGGGQLAIPDRRYVALYGHPGATAMGALGEQGLDGAIERAREVAAEYEPISDVPIIPTFEIITTIASSGPGPDGDYSLPADVEDIRPWVDAAAEEGFYVVLDLQPGTTDFLTQAQMYEELLLEPHVGLALDPEWRLKPGQRHLQQIGTVDAAEVNTVVDWLADLTAENSLPQKLLVLHQFRLDMITNREDVDTSRDELAVAIHMDGHGPRGMKLDTWGVLNAADPPEGIWWAWKNFYDEDNPTWTAEETLALEPEVWFISYQ
jgi:hypothetical protein